MSPVSPVFHTEARVSIGFKNVPRVIIVDVHVSWQSAHNSPFNSHQCKIDKNLALSPLFPWKLFERLKVASNLAPACSTTQLFLQQQHLKKFTKVDFWPFVFGKKMKDNQRFGTVQRAAWIPNMYRFWMVRVWSDFKWCLNFECLTN